MDITSFPGPSFSSSTNDSGGSRLGCHHLAILFNQQSTLEIRIKVADQKEVTAQKHVALQQHEFLPA